MREAPGVVSADARRIRAGEIEHKREISMRQIDLGACDGAR
jgi:hypothetical protein